MGGLMINNIDPFEMMFEPPYGANLISVILDEIDETIGVLKHLPEIKEKKPIIKTTLQKNYAFIAMSINPDDHELEDILDSIKEAASKCGILAERVDEVQSNERITDRILESIEKAEFVIVDLTHSRPNVFYEAGYAQGLNKTPIYLAKIGTKLEFDLKDYPVIFFKNMKQLKGELEKRLRAIAGQKS
jgi:nucleoside 2-deoxyribosyltransferase